MGGGGGYFAAAAFCLAKIRALKGYGQEMPTFALTSMSVRRKEI